MSIVRKGALALFFAAPVFVVAQTANPDTTYFQDLLIALNNLIDAAIPILFSIGLIIVLWGAVKFIFSAGDPEGRKAGKDIMVYGVIALAVMASVWGIVEVIQNAFGLGEATANDVNIPDTPGGGNFNLFDLD